jgi:transposase-like protein
MPVTNSEKFEQQEPAPPDPEVLEKPVRRRFTAEYKLSILRQADACTEAGCMGALLRREGLYSSNLTTWRRQRDEGTLAALKPKQRGRKTTVPDPMAVEVERLLKENTRLTKRLKHAELIIDIQKKFRRSWGSPWRPQKKARTTNGSCREASP